MIKNLNKSEFETQIGKFYYLWQYKAGRIVILYLGNSKKDFRDFIKKIKMVYREPNEIFFVDKKSAAIEAAITG